MFQVISSTAALWTSAHDTIAGVVPHAALRGLLSLSDVVCPKKRLGCHAVRTPALQMICPLSGARSICSYFCWLSCVKRCAVCSPCAMSSALNSACAATLFRYLHSSSRVM